MADDDEKDLFRRAMEQAGVVRQRYKNTPVDRHNRRIPDTVHRPKPDDNQSSNYPDQSPLPVLVTATIDRTDDGYPVQFARIGIDKRLWKRLRKGAMAMEESIDLHGMRAHQATMALEQFLTECLEYNLQAIEIIHGKGLGSGQSGGVLGPMTIHFLKQQPEVIAFCSAPSDGGGSGATQVLLATTSVKTCSDT